MLIDNNISMKKKTIFVLFGVTGDLARRKLIPAFFCLGKDKKFYEEFDVIGVGRKDLGIGEYVLGSIEKFSGCDLNDGVHSDFTEKFSYVKIDFSNYASYQNIKDEIDRKSRGFDTQVIYYLATPPKLFFDILAGLEKHGMNKNGESLKKIVFEKPFGEDLSSARKLNNSVGDVFDEKHIYRIDHYLGKEAVQNFLALRFANHFFEPLWNNRHIDNVQISAFEQLGVEGRGSYYEKSGALRDMVQNHLFQMLSLIAMEPPYNLDAEAIRDEKIKVFSAMKSLEGSWDECVRFGQYGTGNLLGKSVLGYREEDGVDNNSRTETYVALKLQVDNWRWAGVPFYLRTGKRLEKKGTTVVVEFRKVPNILFNGKGNLASNKLIINIQPDEKIEMQFNVKVPGESNRIKRVGAEFDHKKFFKIASPEAYEKLLLDVANGDQTLFTRWDAVEESWKIVDKLVDCRDNCPMVFKYDSGSLGPKEADELLEKDGRVWFNDF